MSLLLLSGLASAAETVFVSEFQARDPAAAGFASLLGPSLHSALDARDEIEAKGADEAPDFAEYSASIYVASCPDGEAVGCAFVVGEMMDAPFAVTGQVRTQTDGSRLVEVNIIDVVDSREALSLRIPVALGDDDAFVSSVSDVVVAVVQGEAGLVEDIRELGEDEDEVRRLSALDNDAVAAQLSELESKLGDVAVVADRNVRRVEYTLDDLSTDMEAEGAKPWERMGMTPGEYMKYKNSGLTYPQWKTRSAGRQMQVLVRASGGFVRGPVDMEYYGRYALDDTTLAVVDQYGWQALASGSGGRLGGWVGFGILPTVEVSVGGGWQSGRFYMAIDRDYAELTGDTYEVVRSEERGDNVDSVINGGWWVGGRAIFAPLPVPKARPLVGGGVVYSAVFEPSLKPTADPADSPVPLFKPQNALEAQVVVGGEIDLNPMLDVYALVPISAVVGGRVSSEYDGSVGVIEVTQPVGEPAAVGAGLEAGVMLRFGGGDRGTDGLPYDYEL